MPKHRAIKVLPGMAVRLHKCTHCRFSRPFVEVAGVWRCTFCSEEIKDV